MRIKVAIFEDNRNLREGLFQLIDGSEGFCCVGAFANCDRLIDDIRESEPDVILMDIEMPGLSGIEAIRILKETFSLTEREKEILRSLVEGMSYKMIAATCFISIDTVSGHIKNIYKKLQVHSKSEAVAKAIRGRIV